MLVRGALVSFASSFLGPLPNIIVFQYNPVELTRTLQQKRAPSCGTGDPTQAEPFRVDGPPAETIAFKAEFDSSDLLMDDNPLPAATGVRPALAALELLLYSKEQQQFSSILEIPGSLTVPPEELPVVLFVWGVGRVLPVRLTSLTIREQQFDELLNPIRAEVELSLEILKRLHPEHPARGVYNYSEKALRAVARLQLVNDVQSVLAGASLW